MRWIIILSSLPLLAGCASNGVDLSHGEGNVIKVSFFSYAKDRVTNRILPTYWVMLSKSWYQQKGGWREMKDPLGKLVRSPSLAREVPDRLMLDLFGKMMAKGFDRLRDVDPATLDLMMLAALPRDKNPRKLQVHRIISVERGSYRKTVLYADLFDPGFRDVPDPAMKQAFRDVETTLVTSGPIRLCMQVTYGTAPFFKRRTKER